MVKFPPNLRIKFSTMIIGHSINGGVSTVLLHCGMHDVLVSAIFERVNDVEVGSQPTLRLCRAIVGILAEAVDFFVNHLLELFLIFLDLLGFALFRGPQLEELQVDLEFAHLGGDIWHFDISDFQFPDSFFLGIIHGHLDGIRMVRP